MNRRTFTKTLSAVALFGPRGLARNKLSLQIGHTGLSWIPLGPPVGPRPTINPMQDPQYVEAAIRDISSLGFYGIELFGNQIEAMEEHGGLGTLLEKYNLPLISAYCGTNLSDPAKRKDSIAKTLGWANLVKKYKGRVIVVGPNSVRRNSYDFKAHKNDIVATLNELGKAVMDMGLTSVLHQHTGTCVETRDETYAVLEAMDTRVMKFGPDIGQLQKGGSDPVQVVKDFLPYVQHMHLKDYSGDPNYLGYCPLGEGKVDIPAILAMMNGRKTAGMVMVELDSPPPQPVPPLENARIAKAYLEKHGITFRS
ncbi:MAG TPA: sugar phosphate isomerase/epimerase family protein [Bryobacteraceae bacterium]|nr:sugar phosphate isomerase/epimerase family protein [Bryobacteraceae bacterium]